MFDHSHHQKIHLILDSLNPAIFKEIGAYFGGGTLITLLNGEYRWSKDIDFICPVGPGYRRLREIVSDGYFRPHVFFSSTDNLEFPREMKADQYGVRFLVIADQTPIKFEIIAEARMELNIPVILDWIPVPTLDHDDQCSEKLLANSDRWADTSVESRDLIDLAILRHKGAISEAAIAKAKNAYPVIPELKKALHKFIENDQYRNKCFLALEIEDQSAILQGVNLLSQDMELGIAIEIDS